MPLFGRKKETPAPDEQPEGVVAPVAPQEEAPPLSEKDVRRLLEMSLRFVERIQASLGPQADLSRTPEMEKTVREGTEALYRQTGIALPDKHVEYLTTLVYNELLGFGPMQSLLDDPTISEIMVNGPEKVYIEQNGKLKRTNIRFASDEHLYRIIDRIVRPLGRRIDKRWPMVDARLPDGSRVNAIIPPCAIDGASITIRKFNQHHWKIKDLVSHGTLSAEMAQFLHACIVSRINLIVSGGTSSGKTTLINVLSTFIAERERIVTIEDSAELQLSQDHAVRLETKPPETDGTGRVTVRDLVLNALRMRPDRIIVGECRGGEALDLLQAMSSGHDGSMTSIHANNPREAVGRLETLCMLAGMELPLLVVRQQIAAALSLVIHMTRLEDGQRKVEYITEVQGMEGEKVVTQDIFKLHVLGRSPDGKTVCEHRAEGVRPRFTSRLEAFGQDLPPNVFGVAVPGSRKR